jgi:hypothetical protein
MDKQARYATAARNMLLYADLAGALRALNHAGIPVIVLKGAALAETVYPNIGHRAMGDADLLVRPEDRDRARGALEAAGYRFLPEPEERFGPFDTAFTGEMAFRRQEGALIELHWELTPVEWLRRLIALDTEALWRDAQPLELSWGAGEPRSRGEGERGRGGDRESHPLTPAPLHKSDGARVLQLAPHDMLLHLCLHLAAHNYAHPRGYRDIVQVLNHHHPFPWDKFLDRARRFRLRTACFFALETTVSELDASVPSEVLAALRPPRWQRWLVRHVADPRRGLTGELPYTHARSYLLHLAVADRPIDVLNVVMWLLFPGPRWLAQRYRLQGRLAPWLACLWHPLVILWQGLLASRELK